MIGIRRNRAKVARLQGRLDDAEGFARAAVSAGETTDYLYERGMSHQVLGEILAEEDRPEEALDQLRIARDLFQRKGTLVRLDDLRTRIEELEAR